MVTQLRQGLRQALGITRVHARIEELEQQIVDLETRMHEDRDVIWDRSRTRWRGTAPTATLTWDVELSGDAFIEAVDRHARFSPAKNVLEVGPGYGRLLTSALAKQVPFATWYGLDLSAENCRHLRERFEGERAVFAEGDVESASFPHSFDIVVSSLTFKHLYPSMDAALLNLARAMKPSATLCVDLIEGPRRFFERDGETFIHEYTREEILSTLERAGLEHVAFDEVVHDPDHIRLLMVARKPA